jgi:hypothetical protein
MVEGYRNYDKSEFSPSSKLLDGDDELLEKLWKKEYPLKEIIAPDKFKSHEEIVRKFNMVVNAQEPISEKNEIEFSTPKINSSIDKFASKSSAPAVKDNSGDEDSDFAMYAKLLEG